MRNGVIGAGRTVSAWSAWGYSSRTAPPRVTANSVKPVPLSRCSMRTTRPTVMRITTGLVVQRPAERARALTPVKLTHYPCRAPRSGSRHQTVTPHLKRPERFLWRGCSLPIAWRVKRQIAGDLASCLACTVVLARRRRGGRRSSFARVRRPRSRHRVWRWLPARDQLAQDRDAEEDHEERQVEHAGAGDHAADRAQVLLPPRMPPTATTPGVSSGVPR
jgi:hypothetical protein